MTSKQIKKVVVVGASGQVGAPIVQELLKAGHFEVSALSRSTSKSTFPDGVKAIKTEYTHEALVKALRGQDAIVSTIHTFAVGDQQVIIDAAVEAGVRRFIPSEYGVDTSDGKLGEVVAAGGVKHATVSHLRTKESQGLSWTALIVGAFFDWSFTSPGVLGLNLPEKSATIFDGGDGEFEATNVAQIGRAVVAILEHEEETANQYVYINSFTTSQNEVLRAFERLGGFKFKVTHATMEEYGRKTQEQMKSDPEMGQTYLAGAYGAIILIMLNHYGHCEYSKTKGLWNERLGLPVESMEETIKTYLSQQTSQNGSS